MKDHFIRSALFTQDSQHIIVCIAVVNHQCFFVAFGNCYVLPERALLHAAARLWSSEVIKSSLADGAHPWFGSHLVYGAERGV
ncbi:hypothetical protein GALL_434640 [mine drainage metagenome]|uniref:Uncharacterized protein n=1 Tax=mine drainage metagenome TaxID=410659 RepID=A0A1J5Q4H1_9ZZZZ